MKKEEQEVTKRKEKVSLVDVFDDFLFAGEKAESQQDMKLQGEDDFYSDESLDSDDDGPRQRKKGRSSRNMTEEQKIERR